MEGRRATLSQLVAALQRAASSSSSATSASAPVPSAEQLRMQVVTLAARKLYSVHAKAGEGAAGGPASGAAAAAPAAADAAAGTDAAAAAAPVMAPVLVPAPGPNPDGPEAADDATLGALWFWELREPKKVLAAVGASGTGGTGGAAAAAAAKAAAVANRKLVELYRKRRKEVCV